MARRRGSRERRRRPIRAALRALALALAVSAPAAAARAQEGAAPGPGAPAAPPREVVFVIDASAAMRGAPFERAKAALATAVAGLRPADSFNVLALGARTRALFPASWPVRPESLERAASWIERLKAEGGAEVPPALAAVLAPPDPGYGTPGTRAVREVVVLGGGAITGEAAAGPGEAAVIAAPAPPRRAARDGAGLQIAGLASAGVPGAGPSRPAPAGAAALLLRLGAGLALFAAALVQALRRGLAAPEAVR